MKIYNLTYSTTPPPEIEVTATKVFLASNITAIMREIEGIEENCYSYILTEYDKDEYIMLLAQNNNNLEEELQATKILLGVE